MECKLKNLTINYEVYGEGKPMLMLHGYTPDHRLMTGCMEPLFQKHDGWKRIYPDLPGMGKTKAPEWLHNADQMLDIVLEFIDTVIPGQNFVLAGESYGGYLSRGIVHKRPEAVDGVLFICPCIIADRTGRTLPAKTVLLHNEQLMSSLDKSDFEEFNDIAVQQTVQHWERFRDEVKPGLDIADKAFLDKYYQEGFGFSFEVDRPSAPFIGPTLFLTGRQDKSTGYQDAFKIIENYPRASFVVLDMAGHDLQIEQKGLFDVLVSEWLDRLKVNKTGGAF